MNYKIFTLTFLMIALSSCISFKTLKSNTYIKANDAFILGNNEHGPFKAQLTNTSNFDLVIWQYPLEGGKHSEVILKPNESAKVQVAKNTSVRIYNRSENEASVKLKVIGDTGLSMGYQN
ncbi:MAG: hypothetical protein ACKOWX_04420 [Flavobacteriales bacterium]